MNMQTRAMGGFRALTNDKIMAVSGGYFGGGTPIPGSEDEYGTGFNPFSREARLLAWGVLPDGVYADTNGDGGADTIVVTATLSQLSGSGANTSQTSHLCGFSQGAQVYGSVAGILGVGLVIYGGLASGPAAPGVVAAGTALATAGGAVAAAGYLAGVAGNCG
jgi:hypothetical protein